MSWNYRMFKRAIPSGEGDGDTVDDFYVGEAYYDDNGKLNGWTADPVSPSGETLVELLNDLANYGAAIGSAYIDLTVDPPVEVAPGAKRKAKKS